MNSCGLLACLEQPNSSTCTLLLFLNRQMLLVIIDGASVLNMVVQVVAGGGAVEAALSVYLENLATTMGSREQLAIAEFAESLLIIPKVLTCSILLIFTIFTNEHSILTVSMTLH